MVLVTRRSTFLPSRDSPRDPKRLEAPHSRPLSSGGAWWGHRHGVRRCVGPPPCGATQRPGPPATETSHQASHLSGSAPHRLCSGGLQAGQSSRLCLCGEPCVVVPCSLRYQVSGQRGPLCAFRCQLLPQARRTQQWLQSSAAQPQGRACSLREPRRAWPGQLSRRLRRPGAPSSAGASPQRRACRLGCSVGNLAATLRKSTVTGKRPSDRET